MTVQKEKGTWENNKGEAETILFSDTKCIDDVSVTSASGDGTTSNADSSTYFSGQGIF